MPPRTFVDRGGTFTDIVTEEEGRVHLRKVPSDTAVVGALARGALTIGTTLATNALLEGRGVRTLLLVTEGFEDLLDLGDMTRPSLFAPGERWPAPPAARIVGVAGRIDAQGREIAPLVLPTLDLANIDAVAIALLFSGRNPAHELRLAAHLVGRPIALGHRVSPGLGYLARVEATLCDAAITPVLHAGLARDRLPAGTRAVRSDGSVCPVAELRAPDAILSGPASGVAAVAAIVAEADVPVGVGLDMGGTSTDLCLVRAGAPLPTQPEARVGGHRVRRPQLRVETIAAGGGSILDTDGIRLMVGPASAGADPGPQCRGRGGPPTLTDAALTLGLVDPGAFTPPLDPAHVILPGPAAAFVSVARETMAAAARRLAAADGVDLRDAALVAYGGAAGQHACGVAERLGVRTVLVHPAAAVLCAWGQASLVRAETRRRAIWAGIEAWPALAEVWAALRAEIPMEGDPRRTLTMRYRGTDHALPIAVDAVATPEAAVAAFVAAHTRLFGFARDLPVELVDAEVTVSAPPEAPLPPIPLPPLPLPLVGPTVLHLGTTSVEVPAGWRAEARAGLLWITRTETAPQEEPTARSPEGVARWGRRFMRVAEIAGETLRRLARSVNIRERLDFSCAIFDEAGALVANAPHVPVHLGAMGDTVRALLAHAPDTGDGDAWLCNDPRRGGSHLPDLTVIRPVLHGGRRFFVANRAHHVDVGGRSPGSMPPDSRTLADEGIVFGMVPLVHAGVAQPVDLTGCRDPETVRADLDAQLAANAVAADALRDLGDADTLAAWMQHLADAAAEAVAPLLARLDGAADDTLDGVPLRLRIRGGHFDFTGTGGPHPGNLNAPPGVVRAAVLYALRVLVATDLPLNDGVMRAVTLVRPAGSMIDPPGGAAVVGGNVETSQRLVDLVLRAAGAWAAGQGTMNNLSFGGAGWAYYETLGGGAGAGPSGPGVSARQVHMTNTRATDPEVLETRLPLRLVRFARRPGSGGDGAHPGGDGLVREIEVTAPCTAALLAGRRDEGAPGLAGGGDGAIGVDAVWQDGRWAPWTGAPRTLAAGDRVRVQSPGGGGWGTP